MAAVRETQGDRGRARRCAGALLATAVCGLLVLPLAAGPAAAEPVYPSAGQVAAAKATVAQRATDVSAIEGQLGAADVALQAVQVQVAQAIEAYDGAQYQLGLATTAAVEAGRSADAAESAVAGARQELGRFAAASYATGGGLASVEVVLGAASAEDLAQRSAVVQ